MATYLGSPAPSSIAIFAGASARERGFGAPSLQARSNFGAPAGAEAANAEWDWNAIGKAASGIAGGVSEWLQQMQKPPTTDANVPMGQTGRVDPTVIYSPPTPPAAAAKPVPQWVIAAGIALALAAVGYFVLGKKRR